MSVFERDRSEDEPWRQKIPERLVPKAQPLQMSGVRTNCVHCQQDAPMESFRAGKCLACQVADYLGPIH